MKYRPDIDGLRTLAVMPVLLFHSGLVLFSGGYIGVDIFFVISGYLITSIIRDDIEAGKFSILKFYERRARRILPALLFFTALTCIFVYVLFLPQYLVDFARSMLSMGLFLSNMYFWKFSGYFDSNAQLRPLLHTWSLSLEEQFYIFMPIAMYLLARYRRSMQIFAFVVVAILSLLLSIWATKVAPTANFFLLPTRSWELLAGALLAIIRPPYPQKPLAVNVLSLFGLAGVLVPVFLYTESTPFPGLSAVPPCVGTVLLIYTGASPSSWVGRLLSTAPFVGIGKISYSLYLAHWPVAVILRYVALREPTLTDAAIIIVVSMALAYFSWRYVEAPFRTPELIRTRSGVFAWSAVGLVAICTLGGVTMAAKGFPGRYPDFNIAETAVSGSIDPATGEDLTWRNGRCFFENDEKYRDWKAQNCTINPDKPGAVLLWGDSYAAHYVPGIVQNKDLLNYRLYLYTYAGCPPVFGYSSYARLGCQPFNQEVLSVIDRLHIDHVIMSARWIDLRYRGLDLLTDTIRTLKQKGIKVTVIGQSPIFVTDVKAIDFRMSKPGEPSASWNSIVHDDFNRTLGAMAVDADTFIDPLKYLCSGDACVYKMDGKLYFGDVGHFSREGSSQAVRLYMPRTAQ